MSTVLSPEISSIENQYMGRMRELDEFIQGLTGGERYPVQIIDHDFAPGHTPLPHTPGSLQGFDKELERLQGDISSDERNPDAMKQNIASARQVIAVEAGSLVIGENITYADFVRSTVGLAPEMRTEEYLEKQKEEIAKVVARMGYEYQSSDRDRFLEGRALKDDEIEAAVHEQDMITDADLVKAVGASQLQGLPKTKVIAEYDEDLYQGFFGIDENGELFIRANTNPLLKMSTLDLRVMLDHEKGHALSTATKKRAIQLGEISPDAGIFAVFSPRYTGEELIARSVEEYNLAKITENGGDYEEYVYRNIEYANNVNINMMIMANSGYSKEEITAYGIEHLPFDKPEKISECTDMYINGLMYKTVFAIDGHVIAGGRRIASMPGRQRRENIGRLIKHPSLDGEL